MRAASEAYRAFVARSLDAARRHDQLRQRLHAVDSAHALVLLLFGLEGQLPPDVDGLADALADVEQAQDWPAGYLRWALLNLLRDPSPKRQLELARRVDRLLSIRGIGEPIDTSGSTPRSGPEWRLAAGGVRRAR